MLQEALNFPLLGDEWSADEELSLLFAIKSNGLNNWTEVILAHAWFENDA